MHRFVRNRESDIVRVFDQDAPFKTLAVIPEKYKPYLYNFGTAHLDRSSVCDMLYQTLSVEGWLIRNYIFFVKKPHRLALHVSRHPLLVLHFNLQGSIDMLFAGGLEFKEQPGMYQLLQLRTGDHVSSWQPGIYETFYIDFAPDWLQKLIPDSPLLQHALANIAANRSEIILSPKTVITDQMLDALHAIRNFSEGNNAFSQARMAAKIASLVSLSLMDLTQQIDNGLSADAMVINSITTHIQDNLDQGKISIAELSRLYGFHTRAFQEYFKKHTGTTIRTYTTSARMERAQILLTTTDMPIREVAYEVGIAYASNFIREYKKYFGTSPRSGKPRKTPRKK